MNPNTFPSVQDAAGSQYVETVYDGDELYGDRVGGIWQRSFAAGLAKIEPFITNNPPTGGDNTEYFHGDHLGSTRGMSDPAGDAIDYNGSTVSGVDPVYTAFGERVLNVFADNDSDRYGYVGAHGYQAHDSSEMPFLHVGARYYDPESGRFLQRDPIGIRGGLNVYVYSANTPTHAIDPSGKLFGTIFGALAGAVVGGVTAAVTGGNVAAGILGGAVTGALAGSGVPAPVAGAVGGAVSGALEGYANGESSGGIAASATVGAIGGAAGGAVSGLAGARAAGAGQAFDPITQGALDIAAGVGASGASLYFYHAPRAAYRAGKRLPRRNALGCVGY